jgi:hypothetical protein
MEFMAKLGREHEIHHRKLTAFVNSLQIQAKAATCPAYPALIRHSSKLKRKVGMFNNYV